MGTPYTVIAFYTEDTPYQQEIENLIDSCNCFSLPYYIKAVPNRGDWARNVGIKPEFIQECLENFTSDLLYLDADARIVGELELFNNSNNSKHDIYLHYLDNVELLTGTIYLKNCDKVKLLLELWVREQQRCDREWDQKVLSRVIDKYRDMLQLSIGELPFSYVKIFDKNPTVIPIIEHFQASRRFKGAVKDAANCNARR